MSSKPDPEDPSSELNVLRREVRRLQSDVRAAQLLAATQQEELIDLRAELSASAAREADLEDLLTAEKRRVQGTMRAAEALVQNLRALDAESRETAVGAENDVASGDEVRSGEEDVVACSDIQPSEGCRNVSLANISQSIGEQSSDALVPSDGVQTRSFHAVAAPDNSFSVEPQSPPHVSQETASRMLQSAAESVSGGLFGAAVGNVGEVPTINASELFTPTGSKEGVSFGARLQKLQLAYTISDAHDGDIYAVAATSDGVFLASGGDDRTLRVFDVGMRKGIARLTESGRAVTAVAFGGAGDVLVSGGFDGSLRVYHRSRKARWVLDSVIPAHTSVVRKVISDRSSSTKFFTASLDRCVSLTDIAASKKLYVGQATSAVLDVDSLPGSGLLVSGHKDGGLRLWSPQISGKGDGTMGCAMETAGKVHHRAITSVSCLEDGFGVVSLGRDGSLKLSDVRSLSGVVREMEGTVKVVSDWHRATLSGRVVACGMGPSGTLCHWNVDSGKVYREKLCASVKGPEADVLGLLQNRNPGCIVFPRWTPDYLVAAHKSGQLSFWR